MPQPQPAKPASSVLNSFKTGKKKLKTGEKTSCLKRKQRVRYGEIDRERERQRERKQRED